VKQKGVKSIYDCSTKNRDLTVDDTVIMFMIPVSGQLNTEQQMVKPEAGGFVISAQCKIENALTTLDEMNAMQLVLK
jgi:hypothetical protein